MAQIVLVGRVGDIPPGGVRVIPGRRCDIAIFRIGDDYFAIDDQCPHMGSPLSTGHVENGIVTCPWHFWRIRLADGAWADNPRLKIGTYPVHVVGDQIQIELPDPPGSPGPPQLAPVTS